MSDPESPPEQPTAALARRHLQIGWWSLLVFLTLGGVLESLHGFKVGWYLDVANETRRLMWTLAHAHGTLLALVHLAFSATACRPEARAEPETAPPAWRRWASTCLTGGSFLLPAGFFLGGVFVYGGDPGLGVLLVPAGMALLLVAVFLTARGLSAEGAKEAV